MILPDLASRAELVRRYALLLERFGSEIGERPLVRQNGDFFPDVFEKDEASVTRLVRRLQTHAGLADVPLQVRLLSLADAEAGAEQAGGSCGSGACAPAKVGTAQNAVRLEEHEGGWVLNVFDAELHHPVALTCTLARSLARLFLLETQSETAPVEAPLEVSVDLTCVALGMGTLALEGSYIYAKSCGGPSVTQLTTLTVAELAVATALFIEAGSHSGRRALAELGTTQRALLAEANEWAASNARLIRQLASDPGHVATNAPKLADTKPWLLRLFDRSPRRAEPSLERVLAGEVGDAELVELAREAQRDARRGGTAESGRTRDAGARPSDDARRAELRALVDEALRS
jgi:hypothetical protein